MLRVTMRQVGADDTPALPAIGRFEYHLTTVVDRLGIEGMQVSLPSLNHDFGRHLRMKATEVAIGSRLSECVSELLVSIEGFRLKDLVVADDGMRDVVSVRPPNRRSYWHRYSGWRKAKIVDFDQGFRC